MLVPPALAAFRAAHPEVELTLDDTEPEGAAGGLRDGRHDLAIVFDYPFEPVLDATGLVLHDLGDDEMLVALPPGHAAAEHDVVTMGELADETWISNTDRTCSLMLHHGAREAGSTRGSRSPRTTTARSAASWSRASASR